MRSRGLYDVTFCPQECINHYLNMTFNEENVPGSPFNINVCKAPDSSVYEASKQNLVGLVDQVNIINFRAHTMSVLNAIITGMYNDTLVWLTNNK